MKNSIQLQYCNLSNRLVCLVFLPPLQDSVPTTNRGRAEEVCCLGEERRWGLRERPNRLPSPATPSSRTIIVRKIFGNQLPQRSNLRSSSTLTYGNTMVMMSHQTLNFLNVSKKHRIASHILSFPALPRRLAVYKTEIYH